MVVDLTRSTSSICFVPSEMWQGPAFLNEIWDLSWDKAECELGYKPEDSPEEMRLLFRDALRNCVARVTREG